LDLHFHRKEVVYILDLPWLMSTKEKAYMWNTTICGNLTTLPSLTKQSSYEFPVGYRSTMCGGKK
jgi:hypothetical protein